MTVSFLNGYELVHVMDTGCICEGCGANEPVAQGDDDTDGRIAIGKLLKSDVIDILKEGSVTPSDWLSDDDGDTPGDLVRAWMNDRDSDAETASDGGTETDEPYDEPYYDEQQATAVSNPYDTDGTDADQPIDGLMGSSKWATLDLTYGFASGVSDYEATYYDSTAASTATALTAQAQDVARATFDQYAAISGLSFTEATGSDVIDADLRLAQSSRPGTAYAYYPSANSVGGDSFYGTGKYDTPTMGNYQYHTILHEIGHSLGLKHGHETSGPGAVPYEYDSMEFTVMTYRSWVGKPLSYGYANETWGFAQSLMMLDIAAIQRMYGANFDTNAGDTIYTFSTTTGEMFVDGAGAGTPGGNRVFRTVWDGNGTDTYDLSNYDTDLAIDLNPGGYSDFDVGGNFQRAMLDFGYNGNPVTYARGHLFNAMQYNDDLRSLIENAIGGSGNDRITGNAANNMLDGRDGDDSLVDTAGDDTYIGGAGTDTVEFSGAYEDYTYSMAGSFLQVVDTATDWIESSIEWLLFSNGQVSFADIVAGLVPDTNTGPSAADDSGSAAEDTVITLDVLANDADPDGDPLSVSAVDGIAISTGQTVTLASGARVTLNADGTLDYDQNGAFDALADGETAVESFTYTVTDGLATATGTVSVTINGSTDNLAPTAVADSNAGDEASVLTGNVLANDSDPDGDPLSVIAVNGAALGGQIALASGALLTVLANGSYSYDTNGAFDGLNDGETATDSFTYTVSDGNGGTDTATVTISIDGITGNAAPLPQADSNRGDEDAVLTGNLLANDSDPDGDALSVIAVNGAALGGQIALASGALLTVLANGSYSYDTNGAFDGLNDGEIATDSFTYTVSDGNGGTATSTVTITLDGISPPSAETAFTISFETVPEGDYLGENGLAVTGIVTEASAALNGAHAGFVAGNVDAVLSFTAGVLDFDSVTLVTAAGRTRVTIQALDESGAVVGTQNVNLRGGRVETRSFDATFDGADRIVLSSKGDFYIDDIAVVTRTIGDGSGNMAPLAVNDGFTVTEGTDLTGNLLEDNGFGADSDPDNDALTVLSVNGETDGSVTLASGAVVTFDAAGNFTYSQGGSFAALYAGETGTDSFTYVLSDAQGAVDTATVTVGIQGAGDPPPDPTTVGFDFETDPADNGDGFVFSDIAWTQTAGDDSAASVGNSLTITRGGGDFSFDSGVLRAVSGKNATATIVAYQDGAVVATESFRVRDNRDTTPALSDPDFANIDRLEISADGGVLVDDLIFTY